MTSDSKSVIPLESNPAIFSELGHTIGLSPVLEFHDVYSLTEPDLLALLPNPVYALILLFPLTPDYENLRHQQDSKKSDYNNELFEQIKWFKQTIGNGCGLYALLHALSNLPKELIIHNSLFANFMGQINKQLSLQETTILVENLENSIKLNENFGEKGQTEAPSADTVVDLHFITFVKGNDEHLYELDGRRKGPIDLGISNQDSIINESNVIDKIQFYMNNADEANRIKFNIMAIAPSFD
ncbi:uncharacterized protein RJT21DRAFT_19433 [Scheffersomyces amazonensis]|uniref:uncharacterized protein n=1 Tax=Scheffersomyces amazonensis TaxID=1078765 RepID=UPI00315C9FEE